MDKVLVDHYYVRVMSLLYNTFYLPEVCHFFNVSVLQAVELNVIGYSSYAFLDVFVNAADQFAPTLSVIGGGTSGSISEAADSGDLVRRSFFTSVNNFLQLQITDNDYVCLS